MEERQHLIDVLTKAKDALEQQDSSKLKDLSEQTIHSASVYQHTDFVLVAVITYALSKILERKEKLPIKNWQIFIREINNSLNLSISALQRNKQKLFISALEKIKHYLQNEANLISPIIQEVLRKAAINKASKIYEHGISLSKTTKILGVTPWELTEYLGEKESPHLHFNNTLDIRDRIKHTMDFFK
ncbi:hypothetical protein EXS72_01080 [Candidatus Pacearchaeota archaeon]|nr:hypothetical protein [Candidatus Pacearchaeota archaeon]